MDFDHSNIKNQLKKSLSQSKSYSEKQVKDIVFHMTDWIDDLSMICSLYSNIDNYNMEDIEKKLIQFLVHVPEHVAAASKLMTGEGVSDCFKLGATDKATSGH